MMSIETVVAVRLEVAQIVAGFFQEEDPDMAVMWKLFHFFEESILRGSDATRVAYGPRDLTPTPLRAVN